MNKSDLVVKVAERSGMTKDQAAIAVNTLLYQVGRALKKGEKVTIVGFGTFSVSKRSARIGRNPQSGKEIKISAKKVAKFKASSNFIENDDDDTSDTGPMRKKNKS
jgi:DNA-binding protein HU-beta